MKWKIIVFSSLLTSLGALIIPQESASTDTECCLQSEWEGHIFVDNGHVFADQDTFMYYSNATMHVAYSIHEEKFFYELHGIEMTPLIPTPQPFHVVILKDYKMGISYTVSDGDCQKDDIPKNMTRQCIPSDATLLSRGVFTDQTRMTETYQFIIYFQDRPLQVTATVLRGMGEGNATICEPFYGTYYTAVDNPGSGDMYTLDITDRGPIKSKTIFDVPAACKHLI